MDQTGPFQRFRSQWSLGGILSRPLRMILLIAILSGLVYYVVIPPWWHYDEPGSFEYAWLVANRPTWPRQGAHNDAMRRRMAQSMQHYGWYALRNYTPHFGGTQPVWIGAAQAGGQPAYYFLVSLPLRLMHGVDITLQFRVARLVSLLLYILTILVIWEAIGEIVSKDNPLRWLVTAFVALLPAFTDVMTSVNDDAGAILVSSVFLWLSLRIVKRGFSIPRLIPWIISLILCYLTKNTAWYAFILAPLVLLLSFLRGRWVWLVYGATFIALLAAALVGLGTGGAASWYQDGSQAATLQLRMPRAVLGDHVLQVTQAGDGQAAQTGQFLGKALVSSLRGKTVTLGAWIWSDRMIVAPLPFIRFVTVQHGFVETSSPPVSLQATPAFFRAVINVPANASYGMVVLPSIAPDRSETPVFLDGLILAEGAYPAGVPQFTTAAGDSGNWNGHPFQNLIENGSAEQAAMRVRPATDQRSAAALSSIGRLSAIFSLTADWRGTGWYYAVAAQTLFRTFWASVAADKFNLPGNVASNVLLAAVVIGILGTAVALWRKRKVLRWDLVYVLLAAGMLVWCITLVRGTTTLFSRNPSFPFARYAFPAILPSALLICVGWAEWLQLLGSKYRLATKALYFIPVSMMALLSLYTLFNVEKYFHPSLASREWVFWLAGILLVFFALLWRRNQLKASFKQV